MILQISQLRSNQLTRLLKIKTGGEGKTGKVLDIRGWDNESGRSVANVTWSNGATNVYRMGHKGKVDLKYSSDAFGGNYYPTHLPVLGKAIGFWIFLFQLKAFNVAKPRKRPVS